MTSFSKPTNDQVDAALPMLGPPQHARYFFEKLENPNWVEPLSVRGVFKHPPGVIDAGDGTVRFPQWPESRYLARMAPFVPDQVARIFGSLKTDNPSILRDILAAAEAMPTTQAATLVPVVSQAAKAGALWSHLEEAADFCARLANEGQAIEAMSLAGTLFALRPEEVPKKLGRRDDYWYREGLKKVVPALTAKRGRQFVPLLCEWLKAAMAADDRLKYEGDYDLSCAWRPAVEEHEQNPDYDNAGAMAGFVREGFENSIREGQMTLDEARGILGKYPWLVFKRLEMHLINEFAEHNVELARRTMMERSKLDDHNYKHEYAMLMGKRFPLLTAEEQAAWLGWVDAGPDMSNFEESYEKRTGRKPTGANRQLRMDCWKFEKWYWIREHLDGERRDFYQRMYSEHGEPELADLNVRIGGMARWQCDSPFSADELRKMAFAEAVERVASWQPTASRYEGPCRDGLNAEFSRYVATDPVAFSRQAGSLVSRPAPFVCTYIHAMAGAAKSASDIDVTAVLDLCRWVISRPVEECTIPAPDQEPFLDKNWQWTRSAVCEFLQRVCAARDGEAPKYPLSLRQSIWELIAVLHKDQEESGLVHDPAKDDPRVRDYLDVAINSPRGKAMEAVIEYGRWVNEHGKQTRDDKQAVSADFEPAPEVKGVLEWHIAPPNRSRDALAIIGAHLNVIYVLGQSWLAANAENIFDLRGIEDEPARPEGWAAWNAYLSWTRPYTELYRRLKQQYAYAVEQASKVQLPKQAHVRPMEHLGEHLMIFYGRGRLGLDEDNGLLRRFLSQAVPEIRRHAIGFVGRTLEGDQPIPSDVLERFMALWDIYWADKGRTDAEEKPDAHLFGTWLGCGKFPAQWVLDRLEQFMKVVHLPEPEYGLIERLADLAAENTERVTTIVDRLVRADREGWHTYGWRESIKRVLRLAMDAGGNARETAQKTIDYLGRRGYLEFGELLSRP